ncbi:MAG TPA: hypothetical protein VGX76_06860, partial [Pirellulales bacterium]|nr:hypothetical protein [Pirellulales bacterium]
MPDGRVSIEIATEAAQTLAAWRALQSEVKKTTAELTAAKKAGGDAGEATAKGAHGAHAALQHVTGEAHAAHGALGTLTEGAHEATEAFAEHAMQSVLGFTSVAGAVGLVVEGLKEAILAQQELNNERNKAAVVEAASGTRFEIATIASGLHRETREAILEKSKEVSANFGIMPEEAEKLATLAAKEHVDVQQIPEVLESAHRFAASQGETLTPA